MLLGNHLFPKSSKLPWAHKSARSCPCPLASRTRKGFGAGTTRPKRPPAKQRQDRGAQIRKPENLVKKQDAGHILQDKLGSCSVIFVGDNTALNAEAARQFGRVAKYMTFETEALIEKVSGQSLADLESSEGRACIVAAELSVLQQLSTQLRCAIATLGGGWAAAARMGSWRYLYGAFTVWIDCEPDQTEKAAPQRGAYNEAEVHVKLPLATIKAAPTLHSLADSTVGQVIPALLSMLNSSDKLCQGKILYVKLGCRGDWPDIQPPDWKPPEDKGM